MPALSEGVCEVLGGLGGEVRDAWAPVTLYGSRSSLSALGGSGAGGPVGYTMPLI